MPNTGKEGWIYVSITVVCYALVLIAMYMV
jgi:hypothetical protein